jgi:hypothetical protein
MRRPSRRVRNARVGCLAWHRADRPPCFDALVGGLFHGSRHALFRTLKSVDKEKSAAGAAAAGVEGRFPAELLAIDAPGDESCHYSRA